MDISTLAIPISLIIILALLLWLIISVKGRWWLKLILIVACLSFTLLVWRSVGSYSGRPATEALPPKSILLWAEIRESNQRTGDPGSIYLWLKVPMEEREEKATDFLKYNPDPGEPRTFKIPYSRQMHEQMEQAKEMIKKGKRVMLEAGPSKGKPGDTDNKNGQPGEGDKNGDGSKDGTKDGKGHGGLGQEQEYRFYELPPRKLPDKNKN